MDKNPTLNQSKLDQFSNHLSKRNSKPNILFIFNSQIADYNAPVAAANKQHLIWHFGRSISKLILTTAVVDLKVGRVEGGVQQGVEWYAYIATCACRTCTTTTMMVPKNGSVQRITYIYTSTSLLICAQRAHEQNGPFFFFLLFMLLRSWVVPMAICNGCFVCIPGLCRLSLCALCVLPLPGRAAMANHDIGRPACSCAWHSGEWNTSVTIALSSCCCCFCCLVDTRDVVGVVHLKCMRCANSNVQRQRHGHCIPAVWFRRRVRLCSTSTRIALFGERYTKLILLCIPRSKCAMCEWAHRIYDWRQACKIAILLQTQIEFRNLAWFNFSEINSTDCDAMHRSISTKHMQYVHIWRNLLPITSTCVCVCMCNEIPLHAFSYPCYDPAKHRRHSSGDINEIQIMHSSPRRMACSTTTKMNPTLHSLASNNAIPFAICHAKHNEFMPVKHLKWSVMGETKGNGSIILASCIRKH